MKKLIVSVILIGIGFGTSFLISHQQLSKSNKKVAFYNQYLSLTVNSYKDIEKAFADSSLPE